jgi:3-oxosteroid 1-dehydrogenase
METEDRGTSTPQGGISRRNFLKGAGAGAALLAAPALFGAAWPSAAKAADLTWDVETDVIVCGGGMGLAGAIAAADATTKVTLLEKAANTGGSTALSGGGLWIPNSTLAQSKGDTRAKAEAYLAAMQRGGEAAEQNVITAFLDNGQKTLDLLTNKAGIGWASGRYGDYHPEWPGGMQVGRGHGVVKGPNDTGLLAGGALLAKKLRDGADKLGVTVLTKTSADSLVTRIGADDIPEVLGVVAKDSSGNAVRIKANKGVVLSSAGFEWNDTLKANFLRGPTPYNVSVSGGTGDALRMAMSVGADLRLMNECWGMPVYTSESETLKEKGAPATINCLLDKNKPRTILVDIHGKRFCNEGGDYDTIWRSFMTWEDWGKTGYCTRRAFLIRDAVGVKTYGLGNFLSGDLTKLPDHVYKASTIKGLAAVIGVSPSVLAATVARFNKYAVLGKDPDFHRGESFYDCYSGQPDSSPDVWGTVKATLGPINKGPYYAMEVSNGTLGTCGGPRVNENAQVLHVGGQPIPRLYAAGNAAGIGGPGPSYGGAGGTLGPAAVFNVIAGLHAAGLQPWA